MGLEEKAKELCVSNLKSIKNWICPNPIYISFRSFKFMMKEVDQKKKNYDEGT